MFIFCIFESNFNKMDLFKKVSSVPNICKIFFDLTGSSIAYAPEDPNFENSLLTNGFLVDVYFQKSSIQFSEESSEENAGIRYTQTLNLSFVNSDALRADRLQELHRVRNIIIKLTNGETFVLGRNDFYQNKKPSLKSQSSLVKTSLEFYSESTVPITKYIGNILVNIPDAVPLHFVI